MVVNEKIEFKTHSSDNFKEIVKKKKQFKTF